MERDTISMNCISTYLYGHDRYPDDCCILEEVRAAPRTHALELPLKKVAT